MPVDIERNPRRQQQALKHRLVLAYVHAIAELGLLTWIAFHLR